MFLNHFECHRYHPNFDYNMVHNKYSNWSLSFIQKIFNLKNNPKCKLFYCITVSNNMSVWVNCPASSKINYFLSQKVNENLNAFTEINDHKQYLLNHKSIALIMSFNNCLIM